MNEIEEKVKKLLKEKPQLSWLLLVPMSPTPFIIAYCLSTFRAKVKSGNE